MDIIKKKALYYFLKTMGITIRQLRKEQFGGSQMSFAKICGVSQKTMSNWERTENYINFSLKNLFCLAWTIGVYPSEIIRYVEVYLDDHYPDLFARFKDSRCISKRVRERWLKDGEGRACILFEVFEIVIKILSEKKPDDITDDDLRRIRIILKKIS